IKALENLIRAFAISQQNLSGKYDLHIAGSAEGNEEYLEKLKELVVSLDLVDRVYFIDHIDGAAKQKELAESKCLILPSHTENFGNVVIEALNQGTPVIASANTPWQVLESRSAGYHVSNEPNELAKAINDLTDQRDADYAEMRINAYNLCRDQFSITDNIYKWTDIYNNLYNKT
ncbi:MAG: glycosyltransferase, partial [Bacteroidetes bacterium]|nr:glycosyltransferase [Bacteroidota bacterium]